MNPSKESISFVKKVSETYYDTNNNQKTVYEYNVYEVSVETGKKFGFTYYNGCTFHLTDDGMIFTGDPFPRTYIAGSLPTGGWNSVTSYATLKDRLYAQVKFDKRTVSEYGNELHRSPFTEENIKNICEMWENKAF